MLIKNLFYFSVITSLDRLLNGALNGKHNGNNYKTFCARCLAGFHVKYGGKKKLAEHEVQCKKGNPGLLVKYPDMKYIAFQKLQARDFHPMVCYADFESALKPQRDSDTLENGLNLNIENYHEVTGYSITTTFRKNIQHKLNVVESDDLTSKQYTGENAVEHFLKTVYGMVTQWSNVIDKHCNEDDKSLNDVKTKHRYLHDNMCWICRHPITCESETNESREQLKKLNDAMTKEDFILMKGVKMRDHCHVTGKYRGPAHRECNFRLQVDRKLPIFFHNLAGKIYSYHSIKA